MKKHKISNVGIGDMVNFAVNILLKDEKEILVSIDEKSLLQYKKNPQEYKEFCHNFIQSLLPNIVIHFSDDQTFPAHHMCAKFTREAINPKISSYFKEIFNTNLSENTEKSTNDFIVLSTKTRDLKREIFNASKMKLFQTLNSLGKKIILVGEKEIEYNNEYLHHGKNVIYSLYDDAISLIEKDLLVDKTVPKLGLTTPDVNNIFADMRLSYSSYMTLSVGCGGFFCMSIFNPNMFSLVEKIIVSDVCPQLHNMRLFTDIDLLSQAMINHQRK